MLIFPEDGKEDNFIIEKMKNNNDYRLVSIDNDQSFVPLFSKDIQTNKAKRQVCNLNFFLN